MLRALALATTLLVLGRGFPILGRLLALGELWPEHVVEYQQISIAAMKNGLYKAPLHMIFEQSILKRDSRSYKNFRTNLETPRKNTEWNHQQTNRLKDILLYQRNLCVITDESTTVQVLGMHLGPRELILTRKKESTKVFKNILKDGKLDVYAVKITVFHDVKKKSENKKMGPIKLIYFGNSHKCTGTWLPLAIMLQILQTNTMLKAEEIYLKDLGSILVLRIVKQQLSRRRKHMVIRMMSKKKCKNNIDRVFASAKKREFFRENTNTYSRDQYKMFMEVKQILNYERKGQHNGFKKYGQLSVSFPQKSNFLVRKKMKVQRYKTSKKYVENHKHRHTQHRHNHNIQKIFLAHKTILFHIKKTQHPTFKRKTRKKKVRKKQSTVFIAIRESKSREIEMEISSELYYMQPSVINNNFLTIISDKRIREEIFISEMNQMKSSVYMIELLKHFMQPFQKANKYFSVGQKGFRNSTLKALVEKKHLGIESSLSMSHFRKHICQGSSIVERTKRSTKGENVQISIAFLKHLTSVLVASATIFGMVLAVLSLAACYLYYKRRQFKPFLDVVLKGGESLHGSKSNDPNCCTPISLSQAFHFGQSQESSKNQTAMATDSKTFPREQKRSYTVGSQCNIKRTTKSCSKEGPDVTIKELYASSDVDRSSNGSQRSFTVRSKAYLFPSWSSESMGSFCDDDASDTSSVQHSSSDEIIMEHGFSNQPRSNTNQKEKLPVSVACHSCKNQGQSTSSDELLPIKKLRISKSKSENDIHLSTSNQLRTVRSFTIFDGRHNT